MSPSIHLLPSSSPDSRLFRERSHLTPIPPSCQSPSRSLCLHLVMPICSHFPAKSESGRLVALQLLMNASVVLCPAIEALMTQFEFDSGTKRYRGSWLLENMSFSFLYTGRPALHLSSWSLSIVCDGLRTIGQSHCMCFVWSILQTYNYPDCVLAAQWRPLSQKRSPLGRGRGCQTPQWERNHPVATSIRPSRTNHLLVDVRCFCC